jgi:hypothetical protein
MTFLLYTRRGCHLCEQAEDMLAAHVPTGAVTLVDVDAEPGLQRRYGTRVPVLVVDGGVVMEGRFDEAELIRLLTLGFGDHRRLFQPASQSELQPPSIE